MSTGYMHSFPFLDSKINLTCGNWIYTHELDFSIVSKQNKNLFFLGMEDQFYTFNKFAATAWWIREVILGNKQIHAAKCDAQGKYWNDQDFVDLFNKLVTPAEMYHLQGKHNECLMVESGYGTDCVDVAKFIATITKQFDDWEDIKHGDIMGYRNNAHTSPVTFNKAPMPNPEKPWIDNRERDDLDFYLNIHK
jgi:trimethylamine monooxygenase